MTDRCFIVFIVLKALQDVEPPKKIIVSAPPPQAATKSKRKSPAVDGDEDAEGDSDNDNGEGYNTRYKGVKRVKVHGYSPEPPEIKPKRKSRPRKSASARGAVEGRKRGRPRKDVSPLGEQIKVSKRKAKSLENSDTVISRPRGRPRKVVAVSNGVSRSAKKLRQSANAPKSKDSGREIFDGIVLVKRSKNGKEKAVGDDDGDGEAPNDERDGAEEDAVLAAVNGDAQGDLSSLGGSNKGADKSLHFRNSNQQELGVENEHDISATYTPDPADPEDSGKPLELREIFR